MDFFSINWLFLANAVFLVLIGVFLELRKKSGLSKIFLFTCLGLALWNLSNFFLEERVFTGALTPLVCLQLLGGLIFANGILYFSFSYPEFNIGRWNLPNIAISLAFTFAIIFTEQVSRAEIVNDEIVYRDGPGYYLLALYLIVLGVSALGRLLLSYKRHVSYRDRIRYFIIGIAAFILSAIVFNLIFTSLGNYDWLIVGRLGATLAPLSIFYAMTKHEFLDVSVIINRMTSWTVVLVVFALLAVLVTELGAGYPLLQDLLIVVLVFGAALFANPLQKFLLTTAKRKFVRGWYSTEDVFNRLSGRIMQEKNREAIFREVLSELDDLFELENSMSLVAIRDEEERFSYYRISGKLQKVAATDKLVQETSRFAAAARIEDLPMAAQSRLRDLGFPIHKAGIVLPFHSPEYLEGLLVIGERSSQLPFTESDMLFFNNLIAYISPVLYRLTPLEKLEQLYNESRQRLHESEIQLIRAQKVESIAHATRQCHHEIRTPLNIIRMGIGRIKTLEDLERYKAVVREEIDHALAVVEETLAITEVSGPAEKKLVKVDLNELIQRCRRLVDGSRFHVVLELGDLPPVECRASDIQVVIINLIHNAMDAMPDGGTLAFASRLDGDQVEISIEDSGEGIPESLRSRVWEPYVSGRPTQAGNSTAGRGWGLTIVNRIINEHGGTIKFTSVEGHGTRFVFSLPLQQATVAEADDRENVAAEAGGEAGADKAHEQTGQAGAGARPYLT